MHQKPIAAIKSSLLTARLEIVLECAYLHTESRVHAYCIGSCSSYRFHCRADLDLKNFETHAQGLSIETIHSLKYTTQALARNKNYISSSLHKYVYKLVSGERSGSLPVMRDMLQHLLMK